VLLRGHVERRVGLAAGRGEVQVRQPRVLLRDRAAHELAPLELREDPAQISRVEREAGADLRGGRLVAMRELVEHAAFRQRERALEPAFVQKSDLAGVETVEGANGFDGLVHGRSPGTNLNHVS
jgi:hypothetical protein